MEITNIDSFLPYLKSIHERTMRVARVIPSDKLEWTYAPGKFTLGDLLRHIAAIERYLGGDRAGQTQSRGFEKEIRHPGRVADQHLEDPEVGGGA
jgi:hypothetical protein